jgi:tetratricopeptide (TPR) repeat protein
MSRDLSTLITMGKHAFDEKDFPRAERLLREAVEGGAAYADIHHTLGLIHHQWGDFEKAIECFEKGLEVNPGYTEALLSLSITLNELGRYEEAKDAYRRANASIAPPSQDTVAQGNLFRGKIANLHAELAELYLALGQHADAIREYRQALTVAPGFPDLRIRLATALREAGRLEDALVETGRVVAEHPENISALTQQGIVNLLLGRKNDARRDWEAALFRDPLNKLIQLYLNTLDRDGTETVKPVE